jgi:hypothetical protein
MCRTILSAAFLYMPLVSVTPFSFGAGFLAGFFDGLTCVGGDGSGAGGFSTFGSLTLRGCAAI